MLELWKDIPSYEGHYQVSNFGRVKSIKNDKARILKERYSNGYVLVLLYKDGIAKSYKVHRLVAMAFIENSNNLTQVNHKDFNRKNNIVENLEWCSAKENIQHNFKKGNVENIIKHSKELGEKYGGNKKAMNVLKMKLSKKVCQIDKNTKQIIKVWNSSKEVERTLKIANSSISNCCLGKRKTAGGFIWKHWSS